MYKVSVLIPTYNSASHIGRCLESAFSQTLGGIEYIIVDDASTDDTLTRIRETMASFPDRAQDVRIISHQVNLGSCAARKTALEAASGEFIIHLDSDDWVDAGCYEAMYIKAVTTGADVVCCSYVEEREGGPCKGRFGASVPRDYDQRLGAVIALKAAPFVWSKLARRSLFCDSRFRHPAHDMAEDWVLCVQYALIARKWEYIEKPFYHYRINSSSISHNAATKGNAIRIMEMEKNNVEDVAIQLQDLSIADRYAREIEARKSNVKRFLLPFLTDKDARRLWKSTFPEINISMLVNRLIPAEYRVKHAFALLGLYSSLYGAFNTIRRK